MRDKEFATEPRKTPGAKRLEGSTHSSLCIRIYELTTGHIAPGENCPCIFFLTLRSIIQSVEGFRGQPMSHTWENEEETWVLVFCFQVQDLLSFNTEALFRSYTHINILRLKSSSLHRSRFVCRRNLHISGCGTFQRTSPRRFQVETGGNLLSTFSGTEVNLNTWQDCRDNFLCKSAHSFMLYIITFVRTMSVRTL